MAALPGKSPDARSPDAVPGLGTTKSNDNLAKSPDGLPGAGMVPSNNNVPGGVAPAPVAVAPAPMAPGAPPLPPAAAPAVARPVTPAGPPKPRTIMILKIVISVLCFLCTFMLFRPFSLVPKGPPMSSEDYSTKLVYGTPASRKYHVERAQVCFVVLYTILELAGLMVIGVAVHLEVPVLYIASGGIRAAQVMVCITMYGLFFGPTAEDVSKLPSGPLADVAIEAYLKLMLPIIFSFIFTFIFLVAIYALSLVLALMVKKSVVYKAQNPDKLGT